MPRLFLAVSLTLAFALTLQAADWPQFRGPKRDGVATEKGLLKEWPEKGPPVAWKSVGVGVGFSSVAVVGDKVFTMGDLNNESHAFAVNRENVSRCGRRRSAAAAGTTRGRAAPPPWTATTCTSSGRWATSCA